MAMFDLVRIAAEERGFDCEPALTRGGVRLSHKGQRMQTADGRGAFRYTEALAYLRNFPPADQWIRPPGKTRPEPRSAR